MRRSLVMVILVVALAGCGSSNNGGGGGNVPNGPSGDPVAAVNGFVNAIKAKAFDTIGNLVCAAKKDEIVGGLTGGTSTAQALVDAMTFDVKDLSVEQKSISGDNAVVHVKGTLTTTVDPAKGKDAVRQMFAAAMPSGTPVSDDQVNQMLATLDQERPIDADVDVTKENGGWVVCSDLSGSGG
jgi:hypothetical protein